MIFEDIFGFIADLFSQIFGVIADLLSSIGLNF